MPYRYWHAGHCIYVRFCCAAFQAYYGGEARCDEQAGAGDQFDPRELVCGACSDVAMAQVQGHRLNCPVLQVVVSLCHTFLSAL